MSVLILHPRDIQNSLGTDREAEETKKSNRIVLLPEKTYNRKSIGLTGGSSLGQKNATPPYFVLAVTMMVVE